MLLQILYTSDATEAFEASGLEDVLNASQRNNRQNDVTGLLLHVDGHFLQVLEGPENSVRERYAIISQDARHRNCCLVHEQRVTHRTFPEWSMGSHDVDAASESARAIKALGSAGDIEALSRDKPEVLQLWLEAFSEAHLGSGDGLDRASADLVCELN
ncbi:MAG: BLUF domain-containing protein [Pseudomonadota bacterium]